MHANPGSPKKPCWATWDGRHQWIWWRPKVSRRAVEMCWICGAKPQKGVARYGEGN